MKRFVLTRLASAFVVVIGVSTCVFLLLHLIPGDPVDAMLGETASIADRESLRRALGLDDSLWIQWGRFYADLVRFDLGQSIASQQTVVSLIAERIPATARLACAAIGVAIVCAFPLAIVAALRVGTVWDTAASTLSLVGLSVPNFLLGPLLIVVFALWLGWFPVGGTEGAGAIVLPAVTLGVSLAAILVRMIRAALLDVLSQAYIVAARARGLSATRVVLGHALNNAGLPILTIIGMQLGVLLAGAVITEIVFAWPGIGQLTIESIQRRDYPVVQACVLLISFVYVIVNTLTDVAYVWLDPRISYS